MSPTRSSRRLSSISISSSSSKLSMRSARTRASNSLGSFVTEFAPSRLCGVNGEADLLGGDRHDALRRIARGVEIVSAGHLPGGREVGVAGAVQQLARLQEMELLGERHDAVGGGAAHEV